MSLFTTTAYALDNCLKDSFTLLESVEYSDGSYSGCLLPPSPVGSCGYTAMSMLLMFCDTYWNDRFVDFNYEWQPGVYDSFNDRLEETFAPIEEAKDWNDYIDENISDPSQSDLYYKAYTQNHDHEFFESYLVSLGLLLGYHSDPNDTLGLTDSQTEWVLLYN